MELIYLIGGCFIATGFILMLIKLLWALRDDSKYRDNSHDKYYDVEVICKNCGNYNDIEVPKGTLIKDYLKNYECIKCGCKGVTKEE